MGCLTTKYQEKPAKNETPSTMDSKAYSWDKKETVNPNDFMVVDANNETIVKLPGSVNGQQFIIQNCENSNIYIMDHINTASVDDCSNCNIFLGPTKGSVFLRDCRECHFLIAAQQFRARDCKLVDIFLCCPTQPIIESCSDMQFGCFRFYYEILKEQFQTVHLSIFNNNWSNIHDFTPAEGDQNWNLIPKGVAIEEYFHFSTPELLNSLHIKLDPLSSTVPYTSGYHQKISQQSCLVAFFNDDHSSERAMSFIKEVEKSSNILIRAKQVHLEPIDSQRIFETDSYNCFVKKGPVIALEINGENCIQCCQEIARKIVSETRCPNLIYTSNSSRAASRQAENVFNYGDIHMSE